MIVKSSGAVHVLFSALLPLTQKQEAQLVLGIANRPLVHE